MDRFRRTGNVHIYLELLFVYCKSYGFLWISHEKKPTLSLTRPLAAAALFYRCRSCLCRCRHLVDVGLGVFGWLEPIGIPASGVEDRPYWVYHTNCLSSSKHISSEEKRKLRKHFTRQLSKDSGDLIPSQTTLKRAVDSPFSRFHPSPGTFRA